jgi:putative Mn2+ efflux pump MntP
MIRESFDTDENKKWQDPTRGLRLVVLSVATSIDALAVGFTLAALNVPILLPVVIIGCVALLFTGIGLVLGNQFLSSENSEKKRNCWGGMILIGIGIKILFEHNVF